MISYLRKAATFHLSFVSFNAEETRTVILSTEIPKVGCIHPSGARVTEKVSRLDVPALYENRLYSTVSKASPMEQDEDKQSKTSYTLEVEHSAIGKKIRKTFFLKLMNNSST